jgi:phosphatidylinositol alpha-mannosyltransferase
VLFGVGNAPALADALVGLLDDPGARKGLAASASAAVRRYDWGRVADQVLTVYETVRLGADRVGEDPQVRGLLGRWRDQAAR